jgi:hypothetical protein
MIYVLRTRKHHFIHEPNNPSHRKKDYGGYAQNRDCP